MDSIVETVGSCATLVGETIMKNGGGQLVKEETFMTLLYGGVYHFVFSFKKLIPILNSVNLISN